MREAGVPSTGKLQCFRGCARPTGVVIVALLQVPRNALREQSEGPRQGGSKKSAAKGIIKTGARKPRPDQTRSGAYLGRDARLRQR